MANEKRLGSGFRRIHAKPGRRWDLIGTGGCRFNNRVFPLVEGQFILKSEFF